MPVRKKTDSDVDETAEAKPKRRAAAPKKKSTSTKARASTPRTRKAADTDNGSDGASGRNLVIVESPAKAKTLQKYLGRGYKIEASVGHVKDLPTSKLGVDVENDFEPQYVIMKGKEKVIDRIRKSAQGAEKIYLAPDPDREGEAIAWHIASELADLGVDGRMYRATFNEITKRAVEEAIAHPRELNTSLYEAQQARRILDRLVGYKISPLLWKKVTFGLSAGRVQSVAVRLVVEREREIQDFKPEEYWSVEADVEANSPPPFVMRLTQAGGKKAALAKREEVEKILRDLGSVSISEKVLGREQGGKPGPERLGLTASMGASWTVSSVEKKDVKRHPAPPFITSTLQQEASRKHGFAAKRTMSLAQKLYEGVALGEMGHTALITYMRTDSTRISGDAVSAVRSHIQNTYGARYLPESPNFYKSKKSAQDAHECVRPTDMSLSPENVGRYLDADQLKLYTLVWNRFVASQMADAVFEQTKLETMPREGYVFTATGLVQKFAGYLAVYEEGQDDKSDDEGNAKLPSVEVGTPLRVQQLRGNQHFTQPPPRYSEATLVKELEKRGIGRPSTYASIMSTVTDREYVERDENKKFRPKEMGYVVTDFLVENFPEILDTNFTATMEERLDEVEEGQQNWKKLLSEFYTGLEKMLAGAVTAPGPKDKVVQTDIQCDKCNEANMIIKFGRNGRFLACPRYPACKNTREYTTSESGEVEVAPVHVVESDETCDNCGRRMIVKSGRHGRFLACPGYPECKAVKPFKTGVRCPSCKEGDLVERMSKRGKPFYSCSRYPECNHVEWSRPVPQPCPECGNDYLLLKEGKRNTLACPNSKCRYSQVVPDPSPAEELEQAG